MQKTSPTLPNNWEIIEKIGSGSYGTVYRAKRTVGGYTEWAAVKHISVPRDDDELNNIYDELGSTEANSVRRYLADTQSSLVEEYQLLRTFSGQTNIVSCNDIQIIERSGEPGWDIYIWMELLTCVRNHILEGKIDRRETIRLGIDICSALTRLWSKKVVHRDVKPQNIFVNGDGDYKLGDFGAARRLSGISTVLSRKGTDAYAAPEIIKEEQGNGTADIYSLGLVLYQLMNGNRLPFMEPGDESSRLKRDTAIMRRFGGEALPPPVNADPALAKVILKACAYKPQDRWQTAQEMRDALQGVLNPVPVGKEKKPEKPKADAPKVEKPAYKPTPVVVQPKPAEVKPKKKKSGWMGLLILVVLAVAVALSGADGQSSGPSGEMTGNATNFVTEKSEAKTVTASYNSSTGKLTLTWTGTASLWSVYYGYSGGAYEVKTTATKSAEFSNLQSGKTYTFYVYPAGDSYNGSTSVSTSYAIPAASSSSTRTFSVSTSAKVNKGQTTFSWTDSENNSPYTLEYTMVGTNQYTYRITGISGKSRTVYDAIPGERYKVVVKDRNGKSVSANVAIPSAAPFSDGKLKQSSVSISVEGRYRPSSATEHKDAQQVTLIAKNMTNGIQNKGYRFGVRYVIDIPQLVETRVYNTTQVFRAPNGFKLVGEYNEQLEYNYYNNNKWGSKMTWYCSGESFFQRLLDTNGSIPAGKYYIDLYWDGMFVKTQSFDVK